MREHVELILVIRREHRLKQLLAVIPDAGFASMQNCSVKRDFHAGEIKPSFFFGGWLCESVYTILPFLRFYGCDAMSIVDSCEDSAVRFPDLRPVRG
jgi:hypothetical protein